jgi:predicted neuraminidase
VGGWSGSSITTMTSGDDGDTWGPPRRLVSSPFLNVSTLVKGAPFLYADGTMGLPVYHSFLGMFGELLRLDQTGAVIDKRRLSDGRSSLQPIVLVKNAREALALMRYSGRDRPKRVIAAATKDAGLSWTPPVKSQLANPNSAISGIVLPDGRILVALNEDEEDRDVLSLVISDDGGATWKAVCALEDQSAVRHPRPDRAQFLQINEALARASGLSAADARAHAESAARQLCEERCRFEFSYPYLIQTRQGNFDLVYTWNRGFIKHVRFNQAWLDRRAGNPVDE